MALILIALLLLTMVLFFLYHRSKISAQRERMVNNLWKMEVPEELKASESPEPAPSESPEPAPSEAEESEQAETPEPLFIVRFKDVVEARLANSDLSVDDLAAAMNLSRVQLYRKVKAISGSSPIELLLVLLPRLTLPDVSKMSLVLAPPICRQSKNHKIVI